MKLNEVMTELKKLGTEQYRKIFRNHGAPEDLFGVSVADLKVIAKKIKGNQELALELYATGNSDAMYLAGLVADGKKMSKKELESWAKNATWYMISTFTVPWVASESPHACELALKWMDAKSEQIQAAGWATYAAYLSITPDDQLDLKQIDKLLKRIEKEIHESPNRVKYVMNSFVITLGTYVEGYFDKMVEFGKRIGKVDVDVGDTSCKVPDAVDYLKKVKAKGKLGVKRKTAKC